MTPESEAVREVIDLFFEFGSSTYDEGVTLTEHCLQTAALAERDGAPPALVAAALLHDIGHLLQAKARGNEDYLVSDWAHDTVAADWLSPRFGAQVGEPVRHHVSAKRWLCQAEPGYVEQLSGASVASLEAQGGTFSLEQANRWKSLPGTDEAVALRRWDDAGKVAGLTLRPLESYVALLDQMTLRR